MDLRSSGTPPESDRKPIFAIVDTNYTPSGKVNHLTWFDLQQLRTIIFIYYIQRRAIFLVY